MKSKVFGRIIGRGIKLIMAVLILLLGIFVYDSFITSSPDASEIWKNLSESRDSYDGSNIDTHITYLESFEYNGLTMNYIDRGDENGTPLLLVHGTPTNSWLWRKMIPWLVASGYRVIAPDQIGFGTSDKPYNHEELTTKVQSQRLIALMDHLDIDKFAISWHDQWSLWVRETITTIPSRITHLVIMNSIGTRDWFHPPAWFGEENLATKFSGWAMWSRLLWRIFAYGAMSWGLKNIKHATFNMIDGYLFPLFNNMNNTYYDFITHFDEIETELPKRHAAFEELDIPTTVIRWKHDKILVAEEQVPVLSELLKVKSEDIHILESWAHFIQEESADEIVTLLTKFVK